MKRIYSAALDPGEGAVYRDIVTGLCLGTDPVPVITPPGCSSWSEKTNNYGALPTYFAGDTEVDSYGFDGRFADIPLPFPDPDPVCPVPPAAVTYPNLWTRVVTVGAEFAADVLQEGCFCSGTGIDRPTLAIGRPQFPRVSTLPFFAFPGYKSSTMRVRKINPDGDPLPENCCPAIDGLEEHIVAEIVDGELRLSRRKRPETEKVYRADDTNKAFGLTHGFPKYCCLPDDCDPDRYVDHYMHFPRWPGPNSAMSNPPCGEGASVTRQEMNPYGEDAREPLSVIPVVVDLACHEDGRLYVYFAQIIVHDGHIAGLNWNTCRPRSSIGNPEPANTPPTAPEDLPPNADWMGFPLIPGFVQGTDPCTADCDTAAALVGLEPCPAGSGMPL